MLCGAPPTDFRVCLCAFGVAMLRYVPSDLNHHTNKRTLSHTERLTKKHLYFVFVLIGNQSEFILFGKGWHFDRSLPMITNKLSQRLSDIWGAGGCLELSVKDQQRCVYALCCCCCCCVSMCTCMYLPDQGHTLLWAAQPEGPVGIVW